METQEFLIRIGAAMIAGLIIGFERQWHHKSTGLRTNMLVSFGSALFVLLSFSLTQQTGDSTRIIAQVVTGVGFLGAGVIFREGTSVHGLTSAATIWCSSAIGCLFASGLFVEGAITTFAIVLINTIIEPLDIWLKHRK